MNKGRRNEIAKLKRKKRLQWFCSSLDVYITRDGRRIRNPKPSDIPHNEQTVFKSTGKPCSCAMCSPQKVEEKAKYRYASHETN